MNFQIPGEDLRGSDATGVWMNTFPLCAVGCPSAWEITFVMGIAWVDTIVPCRCATIEGGCTFTVTIIYTYINFS